MTDHQTEYARLQKKVNDRLNSLFCEDVPQKKLNEAMRYSLLAGGKRVRPVLVMAFCIACGKDENAALNAACGIEMLHTYSLVHDDLPCMDNDDLRRGMPTNHVVFGECMATLAGDSLQAEAFREVLRSPVSAERRAEMCSILADAAGHNGICGGQTLDVEGEGNKLTESELRDIHIMKTAALLEAACCMGVSAGDGSKEQMEAAREYAQHIGLAFQIKDDLLDVIGDEKTLGKNIGSDNENEKTTFATLYSFEKCNEIIDTETKLSVYSITEKFKNTEFLIWLAEKLAQREY